MFDLGFSPMFLTGHDICTHIIQLFLLHDKNVTFLVCKTKGQNE